MRFISGVRTRVNKIVMDKEIISRVKAIELGLKRYYTGKPCCHVTLGLVGERISTLENMIIYLKNH